MIGSGFRNSINSLAFFVIQEANPSWVGCRSNFWVLQGFPTKERWTEVIRIITAVFLRETLEAANNDAELMVQERLLQNARYVKKLEGSLM